jgi:FG-GAP repeat protein/PKD domain-containing protein
VFTRSNGVWSQQGTKLFGTGSAIAKAGWSVGLSADGDTAIVGAPAYKGNSGAAWIFTRSDGVWTEQARLTGAGETGSAFFGWSVALSADGNTAVVGGPGDNSGAGGVWVFTRSNVTWTQQGTKLVGVGAIGNAEQGNSIALSADGNTVVVGGPADNLTANTIPGAAWLFFNINGQWGTLDKLTGGSLVGSSAERGFSAAISADGSTAAWGGPGDNNYVGTAWVFANTIPSFQQQGPKLVASDSVGQAQQGYAVALSGDGSIAVMGGPSDNSNVGAAWVFTRRNGAWSQFGQKVVAAGGVGQTQQGYSVALSADGTTAIVGGIGDSSGVGAVWVFPVPGLRVSPATDIIAAGPQGGPFTPTSFPYQLSATGASLNYAISGLPSWLNADITSGAATTTPVTATFSLLNVGKLTPGRYTGTITFANTDSDIGDTTRAATLMVNGSLSAAPASGPAPLAVTFEMPVAQGDTNTYTVNFGDKTSNGTMTIGPRRALPCRASVPCYTGGASTSHTYTSAGSYSAVLFNAAHVAVAAATITVGGTSAPSGEGLRFLPRARWLVSPAGNNLTIGLPAAPRAGFGR